MCVCVCFELWMENRLLPDKNLLLSNVFFISPHLYVKSVHPEFGGKSDAIDYKPSSTTFWNGFICLARQVIWDKHREGYSTISLNSSSTTSGVCLRLLFCWDLIQNSQLSKGFYSSLFPFYLFKTSLTDRETARIYVFSPPNSLNSYLYICGT